MKREPIPSEKDHADLPSDAQSEFNFEEAERLARADVDRAEEEALASKLWRAPGSQYGSLDDARTAARQKLSMIRWERRQEEKRKKEKPN
ncbi:MAG TPA: hypothetical protein VIJ29_03410 [Candidatus Paceibacterota bacterium]